MEARLAIVQAGCQTDTVCFRLSGVGAVRIMVECVAAKRDGPSAVTAGSVPAADAIDGGPSSLPRSDSAHSFPLLR